MTNVGDVVLVKGDNHNLLDLSIMHFTHSPFVHAAIVTKVDGDNVSVVEAVAPKIHEVPIHWDSANSVILTPSYPSPQAVQIAADTALGFVGDLYDVVGLAEMLAFEVSTGLNRDAVVAILERWSKLPVLWCSELVARCLVAATLKFPTPSYITTPANLADFLNYRVPAPLPAGVTPTQWPTLLSPAFRLAPNRVGQL